MNAEHVDAQLMRGHLDSCRRILERMCVELAESPAEAAGLLEALRSGAVTLQVLTTFEPLPVIQGLAVDPAGHKVELFKLAAGGPARMN